MALIRDDRVEPLKGLRMAAALFLLALNLVPLGACHFSRA
jgi:hypothetical protein